MVKKSRIPLKLLLGRCRKISKSSSLVLFFPLTLIWLSTNRSWSAAANRTPEHEEKSKATHIAMHAAREKECILARNSISVLTKNQEKLVRGLHLRKNRKKSGLFVAEGMKLVTDLLSSGMQSEFIFCSDDALLEEFHCPVTLISTREMKQITALDTPSPVLAVFHMPDMPEAPKDSPMLLVLDRIQDPGNLGTLLRTALWYGVVDVVLITGTADPFSPKVVQSSMSALAHVRLTTMDAEEFLAWSNAHGREIVLADMDGTAARSFAWPKKTALVLGNEGQGVGAAFRAATAKVITLPGDASKMESLNVAVSGATLLYEYSVSAT